MTLASSGPGVGYPYLTVSIIGGMDEGDADGWFSKFAAVAAERGVRPPGPDGFPFTTREFHDHPKTLWVMPDGTTRAATGRIRRRDREQAARNRSQLVRDFAFHNSELWRQGAAHLLGAPAPPPGTTRGRRVW
jgi:hypothetical protein